MDKNLQLADGLLFKNWLIDTFKVFAQYSIRGETISDPNIFLKAVTTKEHKELEDFVDDVYKNVVDGTAVSLNQKTSMQALRGMGFFSIKPYDAYVESAK